MVRASVAAVRAAARHDGSCKGRFVALERRDIGVDHGGHLGGRGNARNGVESRPCRRGGRSGRVGGRLQPGDRGGRDRRGRCGPWARGGGRRLVERGHDDRHGDEHDDQGCQRNRGHKGTAPSPGPTACAEGGVDGHRVGAWSGWRVPTAHRGHDMDWDVRSQFGIGGGRSRIGSGSQTGSGGSCAPWPGAATGSDAGPGAECTTASTFASRCGSFADPVSDSSDERRSNGRLGACPRSRAWAPSCSCASSA